MSNRERKMSDEVFCGKISWEGGVVGALQYGLHEDSLADEDSPLCAPWKRLRLKWEEMQDDIQEMETLLDECDREDEEDEEENRP